MYQVSGKQLTLPTHTMNVTVVGNFNVTTTTGTANFLPPGKWYDYFQGDSIVAASSQSFTLAPGEFHIYTTVKLPTPNLEL